MANKQLAAAVLGLGVAWSVHAGEPEAYGGVAADALTTGAALTMPGVVETNPLGWATVPLRLMVLEHAKTLPREEAQPVMDAVSASGWGAAANNLLVLAGASGAGPVVGIVVGYAIWQRGETEREFWRLCAVHKQLATGRRLTCQFKAWEPSVAQAHPAVWQSRSRARG
jgi:hypothetical protein